MKKSAIYILLTVTLLFIAFTAGVYVGRNLPNADIHIGAGIHSVPGSSNDTPATFSVSTPAFSATVFPININTATAAELDLLPSIGPVLAQRIIDYRAEYGRFASVNDLLYVEGIGEKTLSKIVEYITV